MDETQTPVTVDQLEQAAKNIAELRAEIEEDKRALSAKTEALDALELETFDLLKRAKLDSFKSSVGTIGRSYRSWVTMPKTEEEKKALFDYLQKNNKFWEYATVNSNSMNSLFQEEWDKVKNHNPEDAVNFRIPGLSEPKMKENLRFTKR